MNKCMNKVLRKGVVLSVILTLLLPLSVYADGIEETIHQVVDEYQLSPGIRYKNEHIKETYISRNTLKERHQDINVMAIDLNDPYTSIGFSAPLELSSLAQTTTHAKRYHTESNQVLGAINGGFFYNRMAMNLIAVDNQLVHLGDVYDDPDKYVNQPIAFGLNRNGRAMIDDYQISVAFGYNGQSYPINYTNQKVYEGNVILYTSDYQLPTTDTYYSTEVVVETSKKPNLAFGSSLQGTIVDVRDYESKEREIEKGTVRPAIPENGYILSVTKEKRELLQSMSVGETITLSTDVNDRWLGASYMMASGPLLVNNYKQTLTMNPNSQNASIRAPRTAVAIDETGTKVSYITVDGRQSGHSNGMTLTEFGAYLERLGVYKALNLDGGGSTTFAMMNPGASSIAVKNKVSDGVERYVSTALLAFSSAPHSRFKDVVYGHWAFDPINDLVSRDVIGGFPDKTYQPETSIKRAHAAIILSRDLALDVTDVENPGFDDVSEDDSSYVFIAAAANAGIINGKGDNLFDQHASLTRAELAKLLYNAYDIDEPKTNHFTDMKHTHWAYDAVNALAEKGLAGGYGDGTFRPNQQVTRAEFAAFVSRMGYAFPDAS